MALVSNKEEEAALLAVSRNLASDVSREEIFRVEGAVWKMKFRPQPLPFVPMSVEEASSVTDLSRWTNTRVRVIGCMVHSVIPWLVSEDEDGQYRVALDLTVIDPPPPYEHLIQIFGTLEIESSTKIPQIQVMSYRHIERVYLKRYRAALEAQSASVPMFIRKMSQQRQQQLDDNESPEEIDPDVALLIQPSYRSASNIKDHNFTSSDQKRLMNVMN